MSVLTSSRLRSLVRDFAIGGAFIVLWLNLHLAAIVFETAAGSSAWYPARGLSLALLMIFGLRFAPAVFIASLLGGFRYHMPEHPLAWLGSAAVITACMSGVAWFVDKKAVGRGYLETTFAFIAASAVAELLTACSVVGLNISTGLGPMASLQETTLQFFVGDTLGILIVVPAALRIAEVLQADVARSRLLDLFTMDNAGSAIEGACVLLACLGILFLVVDPSSAAARGSYERWYLFLLPMAWAAVRFSRLGAALTSVALSVGLVVVERITGNRIEQVDLQLLLMALCVVALMLSSAVADSRRAADMLTETLRADALRAQQESESSRLSKARFIAATTHDLQPPFEAVRLGLETLAMLPLEEEARRLVDQTQGAARSMGRIVHSVLDIARLEGELSSVKPRPFRLLDVLQSVAREAAAAQSQETEQVRIRCAHDPYVVGDPVLLERVLANLVSNSLRATRVSGRVLIGVRRAGPLAVRLEVHDSGDGMPAARRRNLFAPFQAEGAQGLGIGLSLVHEVAGEMGWGLSMRPRDQRGTVFSIEMPLAARSIQSPESMTAIQDRMIGVAIARRALREVVVATLSNWGAAVLSGSHVEEIDRTLKELDACPEAWIVDELALPQQRAPRQVLSRAPGHGALVGPVTLDLARVVSA